MPRKKPKMFDPTFKVLVERYPVDWLKFTGVEPNGPVTLIDSDVSTLNAAADRVILVGEPSPWLANIELQASYDPQLPERVLFYSILLSRRHQLPVHSVIVLLRPEADGPAMTGTWSRIHPRTGEYLQFSYDITRVWEQSADELLKMGPGVFPLAGITDDAKDRLADIIPRCVARIDADFPTGIEGRELLTAEYVLLGLRHPAELVEQLLKGAIRMEESQTYQAILAKGISRGREVGREEGREVGREEGRATGLVQSILRIGHHRFRAEAPERVLRKLKRITDIAVLESIEERLLDVQSWDQLLTE
jgi:predicted transposase YdaD